MSSIYNLKFFDSYYTVNGVGFVQNGEQKLECELILPQELLKYWGFNYKTILPKAQKDSFIQGKYNQITWTLRIGNDLNHREHVIQDLAKGIMPASPLLEAALKESTFKITDLEFWEELCSKNWSGPKISSFARELTKLFNTEELHWFLTPFFLSLKDKMNNDLLRFLFLLDYRLLFYPICNGIDFISWDIRRRDGERIDAIFSMAKKYPSVMECIFLTIKGNLEYLKNAKNYDLIQKIFNHFTPYDIAENWYQKASTELTQLAGQNITTRIKEELKTYPYFTTLVTLPNLSRFKLKWKPLPNKKILPYKIKPFTSTNPSTQLRGRQAGYHAALAFSSIPTTTSFFENYMNPIKVDQTHYLNRLTTYQKLSSYQERKVRNELSLFLAIQKLEENTVTLITTNIHAMTVLKHQGTYCLFDSNEGLFTFSNQEVFCHFVTEWASIWKNPLSHRDDVILPFEPILRKYKLYYTLTYRMNQWDELVFNKGICLSFALDFAEQVLEGLKQGDVLNEVIKKTMSRYSEFSYKNHFQKTMEEFLDRSAFSKVLGEDIKFNNAGSPRTDVAFYIADGNLCLQQGNKANALLCFENAEHLLDKIPDLKVREERRAQIVKGKNTTSDGIKTKSPTSKETATELYYELPYKGAWKSSVIIMPLKLKN